MTTYTMVVRAADGETHEMVFTRDELHTVINALEIADFKELHFTIEAIHGAFPAVEASITPDEPGINLVLDFGCDTLLS
jgi:hypothetical protein